MRSPDAPNCYLCVHRREVPNSSHSSCVHPLTGDAYAHEQAPNILAHGRRTGLIGLQSVALAELDIRGTARGVRQGWFLWPVNFDPTWLESCTGFAAAGDQ